MSKCFCIILSDTLIIFSINELQKYFIFFCIHYRSKRPIK